MRAPAEALDGCVPNRQPIDGDSALKRLGYALVVICAILLRFWGLGEQSLWIDEGETWFYLQHDNLLNALAHYDSSPPLAYFTMKAVLYCCRATETTLRLAPAICGLLGVFVVGATVPGSRYGARLAAILFAAIHPVLYWHSQDARSYSLLFLASGAMLFFALKIGQPAAAPRLRRWRLVGFLGWSIAGFYTHYYAVFLFTGCLIYLWRCRAFSFSAMLKAVCMYGLCLLPLALLLRAQANTLVQMTLQNSLDASGWERAETCARTIYYLVFGYTTFSLKNNPNLLWAGLPLAIVALVALLLNALGAGATARRQFFYFVVVPGGIPLVAQLLGLTFVVPRYLIPVLPGCIYVAAAFVRPGRMAMVAGCIVAVIFGWSICNFRCDPRYQKEDWRGLAGLVTALQQQGEVVAFYGSLPRVYRFYTAAEPELPMLAPAQDVFAQQVRALAGREKRTVWIIYYHRYRNELPRHLEWLSAQGMTARRLPFSRMLLMRIGP